jgi:hypothetical protein
MTFVRSMVHERLCFFTAMSGLALVSTQAPIQWVPGVKCPELEVDHMQIPRLRMLEALPWCLLMFLFCGA